MPPAFALSQDQTLKFIRSNASVPATPLGTARPSTSELRHHSLEYLSQKPRSPQVPATLSHHHPAVSRSQVHQQALRLQTSPCSSARTPATHPSPQVHPADSLSAPQHPPWFKHAANVQLHAAPVSSRSPPIPPKSSSTIRQITQAKQPGYSTVKPLFICQGTVPETKIHLRVASFPGNFPSSEHPTCRQEPSASATPTQEHLAAGERAYTGTP